MHLIRAQSPFYKNSVSTVIIRGSSGAARLVAFMLIAREYGPSSFGQFSLAFSVIEIFRILGEFGLDTVVVKRMASELQENERLLSSSLTFKLMSSVCVSIMAPLVFLVLYGYQPGIELLVIFIPTIFTSLLLNTLTGYFQARLKMSEIIGAYVISSICYLGLTLLFLTWHLPLLIVAAAISLGEFVALGLILRKIQKDFAVQVHSDIPFIKKLVKESSFVAISSVLVIVYLRLDALFIGSYFGTHEVGEYSLAFRLIEPFQLLFSSLSVSLFASLSSQWQNEELPMLWKSIKKAVIPAFGIAVGGGVVLSVGVSPLLQLYAPDFYNSQEILVVLSIALIFKALNPQLTAILNSLGKFKAITTATLVNLLLCVGLNSILLPRYGVLGAAITVVCVECLNSAVQGLVAWYSIRERVANNIKRVVV